MLSNGTLAFGLVEAMPVSQSILGGFYLLSRDVSSDREIKEFASGPATFLPLHTPDPNPPRVSSDTSLFQECFFKNRCSCLGVFVNSWDAVLSALVLELEACFREGHARCCCPPATGLPPAHGGLCTNGPQLALVCDLGDSSAYSLRI